MNEKTNAKLREEIFRNETRSEYGAWAVVVGLVIEVVLAVAFRSDKSFIENWAPVLADCLIALGVYCEIHFGRRVKTAAEELQRLSDEKIAEAEARASEANQKAQEAILELAKFRAPRALTGEQMMRIAEKLNQFSGTEYDVALHSNDPELLGFLFFIEFTLLRAGWKALAWPAPVAMVTTARGLQVAVGISVTNLVVAMHIEQVPLLWSAAKCLVDELMAAGINAMVAPMPDNPGISANPTAIHILIGRKA
jgi:hypothetical protein